MMIGKCVRYQHVCNVGAVEGAPLQQCRGRNLEFLTFERIHTAPRGAGAPAPAAPVGAARAARGALRPKC